MTNYVTERLRIEKDVIVRMHRFLEGAGKLSVSVGQEVTPDEIIGRSEFSGGFIIINLSKILEESPNQASKYLKKQLGARIYKDELLAYKGGWLFRKPKFVTCPTDGILDYINSQTGEVRITRLPQKIDLPAGVYGIVEYVSRDRTQATIRTQVSKVYGIGGSGKVREGILKVATRRSDLVGRKEISLKFEGNIVVDGSLISRDSLLAAISDGVSGIITGGINSADYKSISGGRITFPKKLENDIGISVVVCEGFGSQPLGEDIYEMLSSYEGKFVTIDGNRALVNLPSFESSCMNKIRKTRLPKNDILTFEETQQVELALGQKVRVIGSSYASEQGRVIAIDKGKSLLPSGLYTYLTTIETKRRKIRLPATNLEVIV